MTEPASVNGWDLQRLEPEWELQQQRSPQHPGPIKLAR
jgi:hypothetical protein